MDINSLTVYYEAQDNAWMSTQIFWRWFLEHFIVELQQRHGPDFDVCLIMDNCTSHPKMIEDLDPRLMVLFLPPNTTALIQPMDQAVISNFKVIYHNMMYEKLIEHVDNTPLDQQGEHPIVNFYKKFNILEAILLLDKAWNQVSETTIQRTWQNLLDPKLLADAITADESLTSFEGFTDEVPAVVEENQLMLRTLVQNLNNCGPLGLQVNQEDLFGVVTNDFLDVGTEDLVQFVYDERECSFNPDYR
ncbi:unnamed protein product, partial [Meganyctiphanes norvegica]